ncbi:MAG: amidase family protein, partial [Planctomycetota bacterium]
RMATGARGPLHGIPILLKDNIDTFDQPTTAGSLALQGAVPPDDAFLVSQLRDAGAIILGKANLTEFAAFLSPELPNGFSVLGGQTLNPYDPGVLTPLGSSAGSAAAASANLAAATVGTETLGSIISPAAVNGVVGIRPTVGLVSRDGVIPISTTQDTAGPITRTVTDAAIMLTALAGIDPSDPATIGSAGRVPNDYTAFLIPDGLQGKRIGLVRDPNLIAIDPPDEILLESAIVALESAGATVVDHLDLSANLFELFGMWENGSTPTGAPAVFAYEFVGAMGSYLESLGPDAPVASLAELVDFNVAHPEAIPFGQAEFEAALATSGDLTNPEYLFQLAEGRRLMGVNGIDQLLSESDLDALVLPYNWGALGAVVGYPSITVPAGINEFNAPFALNFLSTPFTEPELFEIAYAFEQAIGPRAPPSSTPAIPGDVIPEPNAAMLATFGILVLFSYRRRCPWPSYLQRATGDTDL